MSSFWKKIVTLLLVFALSLCYCFAGETVQAADLAVTETETTEIEAETTAEAEESEEDTLTDESESESSAETAGDDSTGEAVSVESESGSESDTETETAVSEAEEEAEISDEEDPMADRPIEDSALDGEISTLAKSTSTGTIKAYGIDVSSWQTTIDWEAVADSGVKFAFIRVGYRAYKSGTISTDSYAIKNIKGALDAGIKVGVYFFSTALTEAEALEEAKYTVNIIKSYNITYPVVYDCEGYDNSSYRNYGLSSSQRTKNAIKFLDYVESCGYDGMMYNSKAHLQNDAQWETSTLEDKYEIWVAQYPYYSYTSTTTYSLYPTFASAKNKSTTYTGAYRFWQFSSQGTVDGIDGYVDLDFEYYTTSYPTISGQSTPSTMTAGKSFSIKGTIESETKLTSVTVAVYDTSGSKKIGKTVSPNTTSYDLSNLDDDILFGSLSAGVYTYKVTATNSAGTETLVSKVFVVLSTGRTVSDGTYYIVSKVNSSYCLSIKSDSDSSGANVHLWTKKDHTYMKFKFVYQSDGYYKIQDVGSGKYLSVANSSSSSGANVQQSSTATLWQVLSDGAGSYYLIPKCGTSRCMDLKSGTAANGQNIQSYTANLTNAQRWTLTATTAYTAPTISGQSTPGTMTAGKSFTIKGTISSSSKITSVTVAVYDTNGNKKIGKTVSPNTTSYSLSKVDSSIKFGSLSAGVYTYKVTATNSWGTKTLVSKVFIVLSTGKTVANGTYYISSNVNTKYCLSIKSDSKSSGANVHLWTKKSHSYMRFKFVYQSNGYYKIQDVGSGKYLSVSGSSSSSGANVQQSSSATLWQVLPDGTGSYYLVPKCGTSRCLDLKSAKAANGQNIQIYTANMSKAQRWKLTTS